MAKKKIGLYIGAAALLFLLFRSKRSSAMDIIESEPGMYTGTKENNIKILNQAMKNAGITSRAARTGILSVVGKESGFIPKWEKCYDGTSNERIREKFSRTRSLTPAQLTVLKNDCEKFFNFIYGGRYENAANEGYKYRGSGYNQLTFKSSYRKIGAKIGVDLVNFPEKNNEPDIAAKSIIQFFKDRAASDTGKRLLQNAGYNSINEIDNIDWAVHFFANCNAGLGNSWNSEGVLRAYNNAKKFTNKVYPYTI